MLRTALAMVSVALLFAGSGVDVAAGPPAMGDIDYPGPVAPGDARVGGRVVANALLKLTQDESGSWVFTDLTRPAAWDLGKERFVVRLAGGEEIRSSELEAQEAGLAATRYLDPKGRLQAVLQATLGDGDHYVRLLLTVTAEEKPLTIEEIRLFDVVVAGARRVGSVAGSVVVLPGTFLAVEHPMAKNDAGYPAARVGTWSPKTVTWPEKSPMRWAVTEALAGAGTYEVLFQCTKGGHRLEIHGAKLLADGEAIATDDHFGATGSRDVENRFRFALPRRDPDACYEIEIQGLSDGGTDSFGWVGLAKVDGPPRVIGTLETETELSPGQSTSLGAVIGVYPKGQLRRAFLRYVERVRAHPYRTFLHYNSWYDIGYFSKYDEQACLDVVKAYGEELVKKRGCVVDSFLFDDGWDDTASLWSFHDGLPNGFAKVRELAKLYGAAPGVWLSPWGGYGDPRKQRLAAGQEAGYETTDQGFALSAPKYYARFREICLEMVEKYGANHFKFDGVRRGGGRYPGSLFGSDFEAAIALIETLRKANPDIYINQTTGTWPSPFWLLFADSVWRGGYDHEFMGVGTKRQQWITYRDAKTYENVVRGGPLFPLSSLMLHGVIYATHARDLKDDPGNDLRDEIRTAFGCGTQLQELYVTPSLLTEQNWDELAEAARWARENAQTLRDVHWVGGSPAGLEIYGWAAWSPGRGTLTLRNPSDAKRTMTLDVGRLFELPPGAATTWRLGAPWPGQRLEHLRLETNRERTVELEPFEVLVFDARPATPSED